MERTLPTCYRHPDRETRLACSSCGRPACVECVHPADVGQKCEECAPHVPSPPEPTSMLRAAPVSMVILGLCVAVFAVGFLSPELNRTLFLEGAQFNQAVAAGETYRLFTAAFLHAGMMHILFNMWALYLFGPPLEREVGSVPFAGLYAASALAGAAAYFVAGAPNPAVGASGAIFGLFGAWLAASFRNRHTAAGRAGLRQLLVLLGINLALPLIAPAIAWEAHLGGLIAGFAIMAAWVPLGRRPRPALTRTVVAAALAVAALALVLGG
jgi:membrane associated rhomboid family serine protease